MAFDAYLFVDGIPGESTDDAHTEWMKLHSYNHGVSMMLSQPSATGGLSGGECDFADVSVSKTVDKSSVLLNLACIKGEHIAKVKLELCLATGDKHCFLRYTMTNVLVRSISIGGASEGGDVRPMEQLSLACGKLKWEYTPIGSDGSPGTTVDRTWNLETNVQE